MDAFRANTALAVAPPRPPEIPPPHRFPLVGTVAPLVVSAVLFAATRSAYTLVFAALGPVVALASSVDAAVSRRRTRRREAQRFANEVTRARAEIDTAHRIERAGHNSASPRSSELARSPELITARWRHIDTAELDVRLGSALLASDLAYGIGASPPPPSWSSKEARGVDVEAALADLRARASELSDAPITAKITRGIGVAGPEPHRAAAARSLVLQLAAWLPPSAWALSAPPGTATEWLGLLPHATDAGRPAGSFEFRNGTRSMVIVVANHAAELSADVDAVLELRADGTGSFGATTLFPDFIGEQLAAELATDFTSVARRSGYLASENLALPDALAFDRLGQSRDTGRTLVSAVGIAGGEPLLLDLVAAGPHAIVGGTTGSGKSELLLSWVLGMAALRSPRDVTFLFVDFKGGASFGSLVDLPHSVGVLTDLDGEQSVRALASLAAELRYRERELAAHHLRSIDDAPSPPFPRLVVVVDEYAALVETFPALHSAFADIAARGRSLGVHLVLCTQRPAGVVRDGILANCALRLSLRVTSAADSVAVLGTDAAAALPANPPGRALVSANGAAPTTFQVARSNEADVAAVVARWAAVPRPRAPWLPPLPRRLTHTSLVALGAGHPASPLDSGEGIPFALADVPSEQAQRVVNYSPREHGSLLVVGAGGSGKSTVLAALACAPGALNVISVSTEPARLWDALTVALDAPPNVGTECVRVMLFDDIDVAIAGCDESHQSAIVDRLARLLREGPRSGVYCVLTARRASGAVHSLAALCGSQLVLRMSDRADHALAGAETTFVADLPPGGGHWQRNRVQVVEVPVPVATLDSLEATELGVASAAFVVASTRPEEIARALRSLAPGRSVVVLAPVAFGIPRNELEVTTGGAPPIVVADPDAWQSQWTVFSAALRAGDVVFDGCSLADFRALTRSRTLPPPFPRGDRPLWVRSVDGEVRRARLVGGGPSTVDDPDASGEVPAS